MPDLCLDHRHPFALVTTVRHAGPRAQAVHAQLDLALPGCTLRLRFADEQALLTFSQAVRELVADVVSHCASSDANVHVRVIQPQPIQLTLPY